MLQALSRRGPCTDFLSRRTLSEQRAGSLSTTGFFAFSFFGFGVKKLMSSSGFKFNKAGCKNE